MYILDDLGSSRERERGCNLILRLAIAFRWLTRIAVVADHDRSPTAGEGHRRNWSTNTHTIPMHRGNNAVTGWCGADDADYLITT
jgi:hypothetical protein